MNQKTIGGAAWRENPRRFAIAAIVSFFLTGCAGGETPAATGQPSPQGAIVASNIAVTGEQVYSDVHNDFLALAENANFTFTGFGRYDGAVRAPWNYRYGNLADYFDNVMVEIRGGGAEINLGSPALIHDFDLGEGVTISSPGAALFIIEHFTNPATGDVLYLRSPAGIGSRVTFVYADRDVIINGEATETDPSGWNFIRRWNNVSLAAGWNYIVETFSGDLDLETTIRTSIATERTDDMFWVYYQWERPPQFMWFN
ncbi:MAG: hypothetical protein FWG66_07695 [Spirochaetes bacterium]|nr:hypothetical protein [Spirochaetota bacterium]